MSLRPSVVKQAMFFWDHWFALLKKRRTPEGEGLLLVKLRDYYSSSGSGAKIYPECLVGESACEHQRGFLESCFLVMFAVFWGYIFGLDILQFVFSV